MEEVSFDPGRNLWLGRKQNTFVKIDPTNGQVSEIYNGTKGIDESVHSRLFNASGKLENIILASPDIDIDVFKTQLKVFPKSKRRFYVLISENDKALAVSRRLAGGVPRVGNDTGRTRSHSHRSDQCGRYVQPQSYQVRGFSGNRPVDRETVAGRRQAG